jgi:hypothetical protein
MCIPLIFLIKDYKLTQPLHLFTPFRRCTQPTKDPRVHNTQSNTQEIQHPMLKQKEKENTSLTFNSPSKILAISSIKLHHSHLQNPAMVTNTIPFFLSKK